MEKTRVRDLATVLGVSNKDILQVLKNLNIQAKSYLSTLSDDEVRKVRQQFPSGDPKDAASAKDAIPGVIIRKRRKAEPGEETAAAVEDSTVTSDESDKSSDEVVEAPVESAPEKRAETPPVKPKERLVYRAEIVELPEGYKKAAPAVVVDKAEGEAVEEESAEPPVSAAPETPAVQTREETGPEETDEGQAAEVAAGGTDGEEEVQETETDETEDGKAKKKRRRKKRSEVAAGPQVKVISRPEPVAEPETPVEVETKDPGRISISMPVLPSAEAEESSGPRKYRKDKRVVEFAPGLVIEEGRRGGSRKKGADGAKGYHGRGKKPGLPEVVETGTQPLKAAKRKVRVEDFIQVADMAKQMGVKAQDLIKALLNLGVMATINHQIDIDTATLVAADFGYEVEKVGFSEEQYLAPQVEDAPETLKHRPPVVTIMGHVDHGKTSLLDAIRESNIASREAGGITQHIGAYHVKTERGDIVFLDTPGHAAFTAMRARGAQVTDIVVLVVAADDGVMEQTKEAVSHSKAAGVPIMVAVNKIDKEGANPDRVRRELSELGLVPEDWGGDTIYMNVSAKQRIGVDDLLELLALQAEVLDLKANPDKPARGHIVEAKMDKGRGPVGTVLVQEGTIHQGDIFICGNYSGRVRAMFNDQGKKVKSAGPSMPVEIQGFEGVPEAGDEFISVADEKVARRIADVRRLKLREQEMARHAKVTLETFLASSGDTKTKDLNLLLRADVQGSLEAIGESLRGLSTPEVRVNLIHSGVGAITESDILLAAASGAIIIGFNVRPMAKVKAIAEQEGVDIRFYDIIYQLLDDLKQAMSGLMDPIIREVYLGQAEVRQTFNVPKQGTIAGSFVVDGKVVRNANVRVLRDGVVIHTGKISSLKRFKDDAREVAKGYECGIGIENFNDIKVGDIFEAFEEVKDKQTMA